MSVVEGNIQGKNSTAILDGIEQVCAKLPAGLEKDCNDLASIASDALPGISNFLDQRLLKPYALCSLLSLCEIDCCGVNPAPQQIVVSFDGGQDSDGTDTQPVALSFSWIAPLNASAGQVVQYWPSAAAAAASERGEFSSLKTGSNSSPPSSALTASAHRSTYTSGGWRGSIFHARAENLKRGASYSYRVGSSQAPTGFSEVRSVRVPRGPSQISETAPFRVGFIADMGAEENSDLTIAALAKEQSSLDALFHVGDTAYADGVETQWDIFGRKVEIFSSRLPILYGPGNHEIVYNFTAYKSRMNMPAASSHSNTNLYWSTDIGPMHYVALNGENTNNLPLVDDQQLAWLRNDLQLATKPARRRLRPWLVVSVHRPLYCGSRGGWPSWQGPHPTCDAQAAYLRKRLEGLFLEFKVDLVLSGHVHNFQRFWPFAASVNNSLQHNYDNPKVPVHYLNGAAGCREGLETAMLETPPPFLAQYNIADRGYSTLVFTNHAINVSFWSVEEFHSTGPLLKDNFVITKT